MTKRSARRFGYYASVSVIQMGTLLFILVVSGFYRPFYEPPQVQAAVIPEKIPEDTQIIAGIPTRIQIPSLDMDRNLLDGVYNPENQSWTLTPRGIHFATASAPANDYGGSTFIYGHNNQHVFGPLKDLEAGSIAKITTHNDLIFTYRFTERDTLKPNNTEPLTYQGSPRLTLQTCSGNWHQNRELFYFELIDIERINPDDSSVMKATNHSQYTPGKNTAVEELSVSKVEL